MPPAVPGVARETVSVGFKESSIYLFSEAPLFLGFWQVSVCSVVVMSVLDAKPSVFPRGRADL